MTGSRPAVKSAGRQGGLYFSRIESLPPGARETDDMVLARGDAKGYSHRLEGGRVFKANGQVYIQLEEPGRVVHLEHEALNFEPGIYLMRNQREYFPDVPVTKGFIVD